ncbi:uncharacterized protein LOC109838899 [Asparagus officinalis]|uniref:uncharacterized protein LOC109838899 n=1 Tax=Asparagus officinalis TaxID=4686 RepID=UPI00098E309D|nr:uncharacterized protein LOC109838899 [Asparagus officinalis]
MTKFSPFAKLLDDYKLTDPNYVDWKRNLFIVLTTEKLAKFVKEDEPVEPDHTLQKQHEGKKTCKEILKSLKALYEERNHTVHQNTMNGLMNTKMAEGTPVQAHIHKMIWYINELESLGVELDNESKVDAILVSLPRSFNQFKVNFSIQEPNFTLPELSNML